MKASGHALVGAVGGIVVGAATNSPVAGVATLLTGIFVDLDHIVEIWLWIVRKTKPTRLFVFFHAWEGLLGLLIIMVFVGNSPLLIGLTVGYGLHVMGDNIFNRARTLAYFFTWRLCHGFRIESFTYQPGETMASGLCQAIPFKGFILPVLSWINARFFKA
ncbi:hypothetical protein FIM12_04020 [SAR202 cluster bacterium AD-804-J14_MRT_500m]|nr:hypothetical protein [SAR202 cluster bacterium AD-804-J14_MRT_500m]